MSVMKWILKNMKNNQVYQIKHDTKDWEQLGVRLYRSDTYHGIFNEPSLKTLTFLENGGGKEFIESVFETDDINGAIDVICQKGNRQLFRGRLNMSSRKVISGGISLSIDQSGLYQKIFSREEINVNLQTVKSIGNQTITAPSAKTITLPGMNIYLESEWAQGEKSFFPTGDEAAGSVGVNFGLLAVPDLVPVKKDIDDTEQAASIREFVTTLPIDIATFDIPPILSVKKSDMLNFTTGIELFHFDFLFNGELSVGINGPAFYTYEVSGVFRCMLAHGSDLSTATEIELFTVPFFAPMDWAQTMNVNPVGDIFLKPDDQVWMYWKITYQGFLTAGSTPTAYSPSFSISPGTLKISIDSVVEPTTTKALMVHEAYNQIVDAIADSDGNFKSEYLGRTDSQKQTYATNGKASFLAVTSGKNIRGLDTPVYCSLKQFFQDTNALFNLGMGIVDGKVRVEPKSFFYQRNQKLFTLANVKGMTTQTDSSRYINKIEAGYETWNAEFKGGLDDPHAKHEYSTLINTLKNNYLALSSTIGSSYAIEATRRKNTLYYPTEDWRYDNSNFWLALLSDYTLELYANSFTAGVGMRALETAANLRLTPKRMLIAHMNMITAGLQRIKGFVAFTRTEGNDTLGAAKTDVGAAEDYSGEVLYESGSQPWNDASIKNITPLFLPEIHTFTAPVTDEQYDIILDNPYGFIEAYERPDDIKRGFILDFEYNIKNGLSTFKLLKRYDTGN